MIFLHISNRPEIPFISILQLFVSILVSFLKREVIIISLSNENTFINYNLKKEKKGKSE